MRAYPRKKRFMRRHWLTSCVLLWPLEGVVKSPLIQLCLKIWRCFKDNSKQYSPIKFGTNRKIFSVGCDIFPVHYIEINLITIKLKFLLLRVLRQPNKFPSYAIMRKVLRCRINLSMTCARDRTHHSFVNSVLVIFIDNCQNLLGFPCSCFIGKFLMY